MDHADRMSSVFAEPFGKSRPMPATVKEGWTMPSGTCPECGAALIPEAVIDAGEVAAWLDCSECPGDPIEIEWPFDQSVVRLGDLRKLGFRVIVA